MKKDIISFFVLLLVASWSTMSLCSKENQTVNTNEDIKSLFDKGYYQEIVDQYASRPRNLSADELAYVADSYYHLSDMINASKYADLSIQKSSRSAQAYYVKGLVSYANGDETQAMINFRKAISIFPGYADAYAGVGNVFLAQDNASFALNNYKKAASLTPPSEKALYMIGVINAGQDDFESALDAFYVAKSIIVKDKELFVTILYNIGKIEFDLGQYAKAMEAYEELISYLPDDYYSYEKLVQCNNALRMYDNANLYKTKLYEAYKTGQLTSTTLSDNFCIDHFKVGSNDVYAYEYYEENLRRPFVKNIFYIMNDSDEVDSSVLMEHIPAIEDTARGEYKFAMVKGSARNTFEKTFPLDVEYSTIRSYAESIISGKVRPVNSN